MSSDNATDDVSLASLRPKDFKGQKTVVFLTLQSKCLWKK